MDNDMEKSYTKNCWTDDKAQVYQTLSRSHPKTRFLIITYLYSSSENSIHTFLSFGQLTNVVEENVIGNQFLIYIL